MDANCTFVVVIHLPIDHPTLLPTILAKVTTMPVDLLDENIVPQSDHVYVLPGNLCVTIEDGKFKIRKRAYSEIVNTAVDEFLYSLAEDQKDNAVLLSSRDQEKTVLADQKESMKMADL